MGGIAINSHIALNLQYKTHLNICCVAKQNITVVWLSKVKHISVHVDTGEHQLENISNQF